MVNNMEKINLCCDIAKKCNSCQLNNMDYQSQLIYKQKQVEKYIGKFCKISPVIGMENPFHYRNKAQAFFKKEKDKSYVCGIYKSTTKSIVKTQSCVLQTNRANHTISILNNLFKSFKVKPYDFHTNTGWLKSVIIREGFSTNQLMVVIIGATETFPAKSTFISALISKCPYINTVVVNVNKEEILLPGNTVSVLYGDGYIKDIINEKTFFISPSSFYQVNPIQTEKLYKKAIELADIKKTDIVLDAYSGVSTIGILASDFAEHVYSVESNISAVKDARKNVEINNIQNISLCCDDAVNFIKTADHIDIAIIDPPRAGCNKSFLLSLSDKKIQKIVYISCNIKTQSRDLAILKNLGYTVNSVAPFDLFPHTRHIECVALLTHY